MFQIYNNLFVVGDFFENFFLPQTKFLFFFHNKKKQKEKQRRIKRKEEEEEDDDDDALCDENIDS